MAKIAVYKITHSNPKQGVILISFWENYGSVSSQWTTNGSHGFVAHHTADHVKAGFTITESILPEGTNYGDAEGLAIALKTSYEEWMKQFK